MDHLLRDVLQAAQLFSLPDIYIRLRQVLDDPDYTAAEVAAVIDKDPALTLRLLHIVNSSLYSFATSVDTVSRAVALLGSLQIHDLVLAASITLTFKGMTSYLVDMQRFWRQSVYCAATCRLLADRVGTDGRERLFVAGLLHDIGHLLMYQAIPRRAQQALMQARADDLPIHLAERHLLGFDYAVVGGELMHLWELPASLTELVRCHLEPEQAPHHPVETALVHLGALLAKARHENGRFNQGVLTASAPVWSLTGLAPEECLALCEEVDLDFEAVMRFFA